MKKILILILSAIVIPCNLLNAETVSEKTALKVAQNLLSSSKTKAGGDQLTLIWNGLDNTTKATGQIPPFYVFSEKNGGFVIVSAEDAVQPILAYSFENSFDADCIPDNIRYLTNLYTKYIQHARDMKMSQTENIRQEWENRTTATKATSGTPVVEFETALWSQGDPYNQKCPTISGQKAVTGCSATAMAIVMRYFEWPEASPRGTAPGYTANNVTVPDNPLSTHTYTWDDMPLVNNGSWTKTQKGEVAQLIYDCGTAIQVKYGVDGTSGTMESVADALHTYMWYEQCNLIYRNNYKDSKWLELLKKELDSGYPIIYSGSDPSDGGHAFVIEGYDSANYLKVNFGWGGLDNGYWLINDMNGFTDDQSAIINIRPNSDYSIDEESYQLQSFTWAENNYYPMVTNPSYVKQNVEFEAVASIYNSGSITVPSTVQYRFHHMNKKGVFKGYASDIILRGIPLEPGYVNRISCSKCKITEEINDGDYLILAYQKNNKGDWGYVEGSEPYELQYSLLPETGLEYDVDSKTITFSGRYNTKYKISADGCSPLTGTFESPIWSVDVSSLSGHICTLTLDNGNEEKSIQLILP